MLVVMMLSDHSSTSLPINSSTSLPISSSTSLPINSSTVSPPATVGEEDIFKLSHYYAAPLNLLLCLVILVLNSAVLSHYLRNTAKLTSRLFLAISLSDMLTAVGNAVPAIAIILYFTGEIGHEPIQGCLVFYRLVGLFGYCSSVFFNLLLAVLRTVKVINPFHGIRVTLLKVAVTLYMLALASVTIADVVCYYDFIDRFINGLDDVETFFLVIEIVLTGYTYPGSAIVYMFIDSGYFENVDAIVEVFALLIAYIIPVLIVLVCMVIQVGVGVKRTRNRESDQPIVNDWSHINTTVILLSALFFFCNSAMSVAQLLQVLSPGTMSLTAKTKFYLCPLNGVLSITFPLLNACFFPVIILARNEQMRASVVTSFNRILHR